MSKGEILEKKRENLRKIQRSNLMEVIHKLFR